jgi:hypothetical protein
MPTLVIPAASANPDDTPAPAPAATDDCNAATLASAISSVTTELSTYSAAHPDANQALIDATRQPAFIAVGHGRYSDVGEPMTGVRLAWAHPPR